MEHLQHIGKRQDRTPYPVETVRDSIAQIAAILSSSARGDKTHVYSKEEICGLLGKRESTMTLSISTWVQYGLMQNVRGQGYEATQLLLQVRDCVADSEAEALLLKHIFTNPSLYNKIAQIYSGSQLPPKSGFASILCKEPFNVNTGSSERAARVFYENIGQLGYMDALTEKLILPSPTGVGARAETGLRQQFKEEKSDKNYVVIPIPTESGIDAIVKIPRTYSGKDIERISSVINGYK